MPDNIDFADCDRGQFRSWGPEGNARVHQGPGQRDPVWAVDPGHDTTESPAPGAAGDEPWGGLIIDAATFPGTPAAVISEMEAILGSIRTGHWG